MELMDQHDTIMGTYRLVENRVVAIKETRHIETYIGYRITDNHYNIKLSVRGTGRE